MNPIEFPQQSTVIQTPGFRDLPLFSNHEQTITCWELTPEELEEVQRTGKIWCSLSYTSKALGYVIPMLLTVESMFIEEPERSAARLDATPSDELDERGFVLLDDKHRPYWVRRWDGEAWLFYWHPDKAWVSLRKVHQIEVLHFKSKQTILSDRQALLYHRKHADFLGVDLDTFLPNNA